MSFDAKKIPRDSKNSRRELKPNKLIDLFVCLLIPSHPIAKTSCVTHRNHRSQRFIFSYSTELILFSGLLCCNFFLSNCADQFPTCRKSPQKCFTLFITLSLKLLLFSIEKVTSHQFNIIGDKIGWEKSPALWVHLFTIKSRKKNPLQIGFDCPTWKCFEFTNFPDFLAWKQNPFVMGFPIENFVYLFFHSNIVVVVFLSLPFIYEKLV